MDIYATAIAISLVVYIAIGNYAGRRVKKLDDYFVAGRNAPTILIVGTLVASLISTNALPSIFMALCSSVATCAAVVQLPSPTILGSDSILNVYKRPQG
jgi:Na+/proline symporter